MLNLAPIDQRDDLTTKGYIDDAIGAVKAPYGLSVSSNLSSAGWYRVLSHNGGIPDGGIIKFRIGRNQNGECHEIELIVPYGYSFINELSSTGTNFGITKIRVTSSSTDTYIDLYYALSASCTLTVDFVVSGTIDKSRISVETLQGVDDAPSGETVEATHKFTDSTSFRSRAVTRVNNNYFNAAAVANIVAYTKDDTLYMRLYLQPSTSIPAGTPYVEIATVSLPSNRILASPLYFTIPGQSADAHLLVYLTTVGSIRVSNYSSVASGTSNYIASMAFPLIES